MDRKQLPWLRYAALNEWLRTHAGQVDTLFPEQVFQPQELIFDKRASGDESEALALFVVSGEVTLTQVLPGSVDPCKSLYQGDVWVHPGGLGEVRGRSLGLLAVLSASTPRCLLWPSRRGQARTCRGQSQVLHNRATTRNSRARWAWRSLPALPA